MAHTQRGNAVLANKPSLTSTVSNTASATSKATAKSGGHKLLFGEVDTSSDRSASSFARVNGFVLCESTTFFRLWLEDNCREHIISFLPRADLPNFRLVCHEFAVRAAPMLFNDLRITFRQTTFKAVRLAVLDRIGHHVKSLKFTMPHSEETLLPPLVHPQTGDQLSFRYTPNLEPGTSSNPKYGDFETNELLTRQWPTLFHHATNVPHFVRAFSALVNLEHVKISCPGYDATQAHRQNIVDFALISLRIAVEQSNLNALNSLCLSPLHPNGFLHMSPLLGPAATPRSATRWARIQHLTIHADAFPSFALDGHHFKLLQSYVRNFQHNLETLDFRWIGSRGPLPTARPQATFETGNDLDDHPIYRSFVRPSQRCRHPPPLYFPKLRDVNFGRVATLPAHVADFAERHRGIARDLTFYDSEPIDGDWEDAFANFTLGRRSQHRARVHRETCGSDIADIPIMLSPSTLNLTSMASLKHAMPAKQAAKPRPTMEQYLERAQFRARARRMSPPPQNRRPDSASLTEQGPPSPRAPDLERLPQTADTPQPPQIPQTEQTPRPKQPSRLPQAAARPEHTVGLEQLPHSVYTPRPVRPATPVQSPRTVQRVQSQQNLRAVTSPRTDNTPRAAPSTIANNPAAAQASPSERRPRPAYAPRENQSPRAVPAISVAHVAPPGPALRMTRDEADNHDAAVREARALLRRDPHGCPAPPQPSTAKRVRFALSGAEEQIRSFFRGGNSGVRSWR